jgi:hypothetical protein
MVASRSKVVVNFEEILVGYVTHPRLQVVLSYWLVEGGVGFLSAR